MPHGIQREVLTAAFLVAVLGIWALALLEPSGYGALGALGALAVLPTLPALGSRQDDVARGRADATP